VGSDTSQLPDLTPDERQEITSQLNISTVMTQAYLRGLKKERLLPSPCKSSMLPENLSDDIIDMTDEISGLEEENEEN